jgi:peroxiredoxin Q/BCP
VAAPSAATAEAPAAPPGPALVVTSPPRDAALAAGDAAPSFQATTHDGRRVESNGAARPRALVVYFYPRDETPGCTREACAFRDAFRGYNEAGADIVGVSTDSKEAHEGFARHHQLPFGLVADPQGQLARAFGLDASGGFAPRFTFVIGRDGRVARVFPNVRVDGHSDEVLAAVRAAH